MKRDELTRWKEASAREVEDRIRGLRDQAYAARHQIRLGQTKNHAVLRTLRRDIARLETVLRQKRATSGEHHAR